MAFSSCDIQPWNDPSEALIIDLAMQLESDSSLDEILPLRQELAQAKTPSSSSKLKKC